MPSQTHPICCPPPRPICCPPPRCGLLHNPACHPRRQVAPRDRQGQLPVLPRQRWWCERQGPMAEETAEPCSAAPPRPAPNDPRPARPASCTSCLATPVHSLGGYLRPTACIIFLHSHVNRSTPRLGNVRLHFRATMFDLGLTSRTT